MEHGEVITSPTPPLQGGQNCPPSKEGIKGVFLSPLLRGRRRGGGEASETGQPSP